MQVAQRSRHAVAYAKGREQISDLLALAGAGETALWLSEHAVVAATRSRANRLANADEANLVRTARAAHRQLEAIRALELDSLPAELHEIAELRLRHPSASLRELGAKARPPIARATAHRRLRALVALADVSDLQLL
jgi:DNA-binding protein WhiA